MLEPIKITLDDVKPWIVPRCITRAEGDGFINVDQLSDGSLDVMAQDFINRLYQNAGRRPPVLRRS